MSAHVRLVSRDVTGQRALTRMPWSAHSTASCLTIDEAAALDEL